MNPRERRLIRRLMIVATVLVLVMVAGMMWTAVLQSRHPTPPAADSSASSGPSGPP